MKLRITLILALALCLCLTGCGKDDDPEETAVQTYPVLTEAPTELPAVPPVTEPPVFTEATFATVPETTAPVTEPVTEPTETEPVETEPPETEPPANPTPYSGTPAKVTGYYEVNLRKSPSTHSEVVRKIRRETAVTVLETVVNDNATWANLGDGWMSMQYIKLEGELPAEPDPGLGEIAKVYNTEAVNVRSEPSAASEKVKVLQRDEFVHVKEIRLVSGVEWGRIEDGWVSMKYLLRLHPRMQATTGSASDAATVPPETKLEAVG